MIKLEQNTKEWLDFRKDKIGASDAPIIMGVSPWKTAYQLWQEKLSISTPQEESFAMRRGKAMEEEARQYASRYLNTSFCPEVLLHKNYDWMIASLDGINRDKNVILEIKCPGKEDHRDALAGIVPFKYYPQLQHQMHVSESSKCYYLSYTQDSPTVIEVNYDVDYVENMINEELKFLMCLRDLNPPELSDKDYLVREDLEWKSMCEEYDRLCKELEEIELRKEETKKRLIDSCNNIPTKGCGLFVKKIIRAGVVDYKKIPELKNVDLNAYRKKPTQYWSISK